MLDLISGRIRRWHWGKLVILWSWGGSLSGLFLTAFLTLLPARDPGPATFTLLASLTILLALSSITWVWLGGREG